VFVVLSNPHNFTVPKIIVYKNAPQKKAFHSLQSDTINATVKGSGWQMLFSRLKDKSPNINVDLQALDKRNYVVLSLQLRNINRTQEPTRQILSFDPDTLYFDFSNRRIKRVPVTLVKNIKYKQQYAQSADVVIKPDYVTVTGPAEVLSGITSWKTDTLALNDINEPVNTQLKMQPVKEGNMSVYPKAVQVNIPVDEFTEKTLQIPVKLINNRNYYDVKVFPQKVKVTFVTSLTDYPDINESFFEANADLDLWQTKGYSVLPVKLKRLPPYCRIVKIEPANVDFIIKK
ncbi:MAG: YbbR-like domain-containing protein, partial [Sphingobacteriales bacterium]